MVHDDNTEASKIISERKKLKNQFLQFDKANIVGIPVDEWTPFFHTNNFFQRTLSHNLGFDDTNQKFRLLQVDSSGNLKVSSTVSVTFAALFGGVSTSLNSSVSGSLDVNPGGRDLTVDTIFTGLQIAGSGTASHDGIDMQHAAAITALVDSNESVTVRPQISDDNLNWYDMVDETDTRRTFSVNNEKKALRISSAAKYLRLLITNNSVNIATVTLKILGQA